MSAITRRRFLNRTAVSGLALAAGGLAMPALVRAQSRPQFTHGVQSGDVNANSGMAWVRADRPSTIEFEWATTDTFANAERLHALTASPQSDLAVKRLITGLPADQDIYWRAVARDLSDIDATSEPIVGHFRTAPASRRDVKFVWSGDTVGQGWGIDESRGGMKTYAAMAAREPDFFIHSGDTIYADGPLQETVTLKDGTEWKNIVTPAKSKVAETLEEYRGQWKYNLLDTNLREFNATIPTFFQWDDHEVSNNWSLSKDMTADDRYSEKSISLLAARAGRAFHEMTPISYQPEEPGRIYRTVNYGPHVDVFFLDLRAYRGPNGPSMETEITAASQILGARQMAWLKRALANSDATWKVIACDMPIGLIVWDDWKTQSGAEAVANGDDGAPRGRELEFAELLSFIKHASIDNVVWLTADVHYTSAHHYSPDRAAFQDFDPFWEFVSGPIHAGTFGPNGLDMTFGPEVRYVKAPSEEQGQNLSPADGFQFFGEVEVEGATGVMTVRLLDSDGTELHTQVLDPVRRG